MHAMRKMGGMLLAERIVGQQAIDHTKPETRYAVDGMKKIEVKDLLGNEIAIAQLMLDVKTLGTKLNAAEEKLKAQEGEIEHVRTAPFMGKVGLIVNAVGGAIGAIGVNGLTGDPARPYSALMTILGYGLIVVMGIAIIQYPKARLTYSPKPGEGRK